MVTPKNTNPTPDYDSPWKEAIERFFPDFMAFFFPDIYDDIDWDRGFKFLDKDLEKVTLDAKIGRRYADKLAQVWLKDGQSAWVLIHIEVQSCRESNFSERIYVYQHRIWEKYRKEVASLVILCDSDKNYRPNHYKKEIWGCSLDFKFPIVKLLDYAKDWHKLERNPNPFSTLVMAQLKAKEIKDGQRRKYWKFHLTKRLYEQGLVKQDILELYRFIDWILVLPESVEKEFIQELRAFEEEKIMRYVTNIERISRQEGWQEGRQEGRQDGLLQKAREAILEVLEVRFHDKPELIDTKLNHIIDHGYLKNLLREAITTPSIPVFLQSFEKHH